MFTSYQIKTCSKHNYTGTSECPDCKNYIKLKNKEKDLIIDGLYLLLLDNIGEKKLVKKVEKIKKLIHKITKYCEEK